MSYSLWVGLLNYFDSAKNGRLYTPNIGQKRIGKAVAVTGGGERNKNGEPWTISPSETHPPPTRSKYWLLPFNQVLAQATTNKTSETEA